jgi:hypothetical protein
MTPRNQFHLPPHQPLPLPLPLLPLPQLPLLFPALFSRKSTKFATWDSNALKLSSACVLRSIMAKEP